MPFLTPDDFENSYRVTLEVNDTMLPLLVGALLELWEERNWEEFGTQTIETTLADVAVMLASMSTEEIMGLRLDFTNYSGTTIVTGLGDVWSKQVFVAKIDKLVVVFFYLNGVSNSNEFKFTLPYTASASLYHEGFTSLIPCRDNGTMQHTPACARLDADDSTVILEKDIGHPTSWTNVNQKLASGSLVFFTD